MKEYKSIVSSTWNEFVKELQSTAKEGKQIVQRLEYQHSFFKAVLVQGYCPPFVTALEELTGVEVNCLECIDNLLKAVSVKTIGVEKAAQEGQKAFERFVEAGSVLETKQDVDVQIVKPKTTRTKRNRK